MGDRMNTELAVIDTIGTAVSTELATLVDAARSYADASRAPNTIRAYRAAWAGFASWCAEHGFEALPAASGTVALFLTDRANQGAKVATLRLALSAIGAAHQAAGHEFNAKSPGLAAVWSGIRRHLGVRPDRKSPVLGDDLKAMLATLDRATHRRRHA